MMKTYTSRSNAKRAATREGINVPDISVYEITNEKRAHEFGLTADEIGRFVWVDASKLPAGKVRKSGKDLKQAPLPSKWDRDEIDPAEQYENEHDAAQLADEKAERVPNTLTANLDKSTVPSPVKLVHEIANSMPGARRKDVVAECVKHGIALNTARTQYQVWFRNQRKGRA